MYLIRIKNKNQYQHEQLIQFFDKLQTLKPFFNIVTDNEFQSYVIFSVIRAKKIMGLEQLNQLFYRKYTCIVIDFCYLYNFLFIRRTLNYKLNFILFKIMVLKVLKKIFMFAK